MLTTYSRKGKLAYLDPVRAVLVEAKPEEAVRQEFILRLLTEFRVPLDAISVEYPLVRSGVTSRRRADILIEASSGPLMVVECKEPGTPLHDGVRDQALSYANELHCPYVGLTNGGKTEAYFLGGGGLRQLQVFPTFDQLRRMRGLQYRALRSREFVPST